MNVYLYVHIYLYTYVNIKSKTWMLEINYKRIKVVITGHIHMCMLF